MSDPVPRTNLPAATRQGDGFKDKQKLVLDAIDFDKSTTDQIWEFIQRIAKELMARDPNLQSHDVLVEIRGVPINIELKFADGRLVDFVPSFANEVCDAGISIFDVNKQKLSAKDFFEARMRVLKFLVERSFARTISTNLSAGPDRDDIQLKRLSE